MSNETKQTAVEWLESIFYSQSKSVGFDKWVIIESEMDRIIDKAKEMEREQHSKTWNNALEAFEKKLELLKQTYGGNK